MYWILSVMSLIMISFFSQLTQGIHFTQCQIYTNLTENIYMSQKFLAVSRGIHESILGLHFSYKTSVLAGFSWSHSDDFNSMQSKLAATNHNVCYNISVIAWWSVLLMEETGVPKENQRPVARHWRTLSHKWAGFEFITLVVIGTDCTGSCKSNYHMNTSTTAPISHMELLWVVFNMQRAWHFTNTRHIWYVPCN